MTKQKQIGRFQRVALSITRSIGSPTSVILHTVFFALNFAAVWLSLMTFDKMLLVLTMVVSLEAIYLSIFIQMSINYAAESIEQVEQDIDEIQEDMEEIAEDVEEIAEDVDDIQEEIEDISEDDTKETARAQDHASALASIQSDLRRLMEDIERLKKTDK